MGTTRCKQCEETVEVEEDTKYCTNCGNKLLSCSRCNSVILDRKLKRSPLIIGEYEWYLCPDCDEELRMKFMKNKDFV